MWHSFHVQYTHVFCLFPNFLTGQRCRQVTETWSHRGMCNKLQEVKAEPPPPLTTAPAQGTVLDHKVRFSFLLVVFFTFNPDYLHISEDKMLY